MGNRVYKISSTQGTRKYIVDIAGGLPTILCEIDPCEADPNRSLKKAYYYANAQILAQYDCNGLDDNNEVVIDGKYFYIHDRLGSVRLVVDSAGDVNNTYTYNPYGEDLATECTETTENPYKFTGQYYDSEINQYYLRARQYDPALMRFTGRDPVRGKFQNPLTFNPYLYCQDDPTNMTDPDGRFAWLAARLLVGAVSGALSSGYASDWKGKSWAWGAAAGAVSAILPASYSAVVLSAGMSGATNAYATYQKTGDIGQAGLSFFSSFAGGMLGGSASYAMGLRYGPLMGMDTSKNIQESMGLISFIFGETVGSTYGSYLSAPAGSLDEIKEQREKQREDLRKLGFGQ